MYPVFNLGPGSRLAIWTQGCSIACPGCVNPELWDAHSGKTVEVASLVSSLLKIVAPFDGITITGGEPFDQYPALISFCTFLKSKSKIPIFVFTGYILAQLQQKFPDQLFTHCIDMLMDGSYEKSRHENNNIKGSSNQNFYRFVNNNTTDESGLENNIQIIREEASSNSPKWSVDVNEDHQVYMSGIPKSDDLSNLSRQLTKSGIKLKF
jgi:anaerobic ribonucleoside-triphosphate reductase activating protein